MSKHAFTKNFKVFKASKSKDAGYLAKPKKWVVERGRKVVWKRQRTQDTRSKMLERIPEEPIPEEPEEPTKL